MEWRWKKCCLLRCYSREVWHGHLWLKQGESRNQIRLGARRGVVEASGWWRKQEGSGQLGHNWELKRLVLSQTKIYCLEPVNDDGCLACLRLQLLPYRPFGEIFPGRLQHEQLCNVRIWHLWRSPCLLAVSIIETKDLLLFILRYIVYRWTEHDPFHWPFRPELVDVRPCGMLSVWCRWCIRRRLGQSCEDVPYLIRGNLNGHIEHFRSNRRHICTNDRRGHLSDSGNNLHNLKCLRGSQLPVFSRHWTEGLRCPSTKKVSLKKNNFLKTINKFIFL